jgi:predicted DNA-binding transcriptional regulator AlpA
MSRPRSRADTFYPPRGMRADRAAAYLDMSETSFHTLVAEGELPAGVRIRGMTVWDRLELDAAFENFKAKRQARGNTVAAALGIEDQ